MLIFCPCIQHRNDKNLTILPLYIARHRRGIFGYLQGIFKGFTLIFGAPQAKIFGIISYRVKKKRC